MRIKESLASTSSLFQALADPTRLRILGMLRAGEVCVCHLVAALRLPQSTVSRHLACLKRAGLVEAREKGTWNHYRLCRPASPAHRKFLACLSQCLGDVEELAPDRERLSRRLAACAPAAGATTRRQG